jgi:hypothetical protein
VYFSHLGYTSLVTDNGHLVISDRELPMILLVDKEGDILKYVGKGRGPGEILDAYRLSSDRHKNLYAYDQGNSKIVLFDNELNYLSEIKTKPFEGSGVVAAFPFSENRFLLELTSFSFLKEKDKPSEKIFIQYDAKKEEYGKEIALEDRPYARDYLEGRIVGATPVPYSRIQLTDYDPESETLFSFDTKTSLIAELNYNFDTLNVIPINLSKELINEEEKDSLRKNANTDKAIDRWKTIQPLLPEYKSVAEKMLVHGNHIWLQSNLRGDYQKWFVLNKKGKIQKIVNLPKDGMVTHISNESIGIRMDNSTFGLFEAVN